MNNKLTFKKTPLALAIAGLALSMGVQADSPFQFGRWAGGGSGGSGPGNCTENVGDRAGIAAGACNQDETLVQRTLTSTGMIMYAVINDGFGEGGEGNSTGVGTMDLDAPDDFEGDGTASFSLNPDDFDGEGDGNYSGPAVFEGGEGFFETENDNGGAIGGQLTSSTTSFFGLFALDGITDGGEGFGFFVAGEPTSAGDMAGLVAGNVIGYYEGFSSPFTEYYVNIGVNFGTAEWSGSWVSDFAALEYFEAEGNVNGANFNANFISVGDRIEADPGSFVEGTFFGPEADALGGHFEVSAYDGETVVSDVFFATLCDECD